VFVSKTPVSQDLDFVAVIPEVPLPTEKARAVLPAQYSRKDVVANLQRTALLTACFFSGKNLSPELFDDRLHQPYRSPLIPGIAQCLAYRREGLDGVYLSGAGSAVMAIARHSALEIGTALVEEFRRQGIRARELILKADNRGAELSDSSGIRTLSADTAK
jgi:homoserine kinase